MDCLDAVRLCSGRARLGEERTRPASHESLGRARAKQNSMCRADAKMSWTRGEWRRPLGVQRPFDEAMPQVWYSPADIAASCRSEPGRRRRSRAHSWPTHAHCATACLRRTRLRTRGLAALRVRGSRLERPHTRSPLLRATRWRHRLRLRLRPIDARPSVHCKIQTSAGALQLELMRWSLLAPIPTPSTRARGPFNKFV